MRISITCSTCGKEFTVKEERAGRRVGCKHCSAIVNVPHKAASQTPAVPATPMLTRSNQVRSTEGAVDAAVLSPSRLPLILGIAAALVLVAVLCALFLGPSRVPPAVPPSNPFATDSASRNS